MDLKRLVSILLVILGDVRFLLHLFHPHVCHRQTDEMEHHFFRNHSREIVIIWFKSIANKNARLLLETYNVTSHSSFHSFFGTHDSFRSWVQEYVTHGESKCAMCIGQHGNRCIGKCRPGNRCHPEIALCILLKKSIETSDCFRWLFPGNDITRGRIGSEHR